MCSKIRFYVVPGAATAAGEPEMWTEVIKFISLHNFKGKFVPELKFNMEAHYGSL